MKTNTNVSTDTNTHTRYFIRNAGQSVWNSILKCMLMHSLEATLSCRLLIYFSGVIYSKSKLQQLLSTNVCPVVEVPANFDSGKNQPEHRLNKLCIQERQNQQSVPTFCNLLRYLAYTFLNENRTVGLEHIRTEINIDHI